MFSWGMRRFPSVRACVLVHDPFLLAAVPSALKRTLPFSVRLAAFHSIALRSIV